MTKFERFNDRRITAEELRSLVEEQKPSRGSAAGEHFSMKPTGR